MVEGLQVEVVVGEEEEYQLQGKGYAADDRTGFEIEAPDRS
jgi:hypothetical protein